MNPDHPNFRTIDDWQKRCYKLVQKISEKNQEIERLNKKLTNKSGAMPLELVDRRDELYGREINQLREENEKLKELNQKLLDKLANKHVFVMKENKILREGLEKIEVQNRSRGYPTGSEWMKLVAAAEEALAKVSKG